MIEEKKMSILAKILATVGIVGYFFEDVSFRLLKAATLACKARREINSAEHCDR